MKIAFTSCIDAVDDPVQPVWQRIQKAQPDVLLLLGDTMYMDYGIAPFAGNRCLGWPRKESDAAFAEVMHERYRTQWAVPSFRALLNSGIQLGMTWDDHDFAWNNARGQGSARRYTVPQAKRQIAQGLFRQFVQACSAPDASTYPAMPSLASLVGGVESGIQSSFDRDKVRFVMVDGRSFRQDPNDGPDAELLGRAQRKWLAALMNGPQELTIIGSGSILSGVNESWDDYLDYRWLLGEASGKVIVLSGDIHRNVLPARHSDNVIEITSSGAARPGLGGAKGNFGILEVGDRTSVRLYSRENPEGVQAKVEFGRAGFVDED